MNNVYDSTLKMHLCGAVFLSVLLVACVGSDVREGQFAANPLDPFRALESFQIEDGFRVELVASEPEVVDPVEVSFDENGGLWVAETSGHSIGPQAGESQRSRIRFLEDRNGDGHFETVRMFADGIFQVTSILPWKGGVLVSAAPGILYLRDTDEDGRANLSEVWLRGFVPTGLSVKAPFKNLRLGVDNWIYVTNSGRATKITLPKWPEQPPAWFGGEDFRFHPVRGLIEKVAGPTEFGMAFDSWGNRFGSQHTTRLQHEVVPARYLDKRIFTEMSSVFEDLAVRKPDTSMIYSSTEKKYVSNTTGTLVYLGDAFPPRFGDSVFSANAEDNLVHLDFLAEEGLTFRADSFPQGREFLTSEDVWFCPTSFANGPDGNLYLVDLYREPTSELSPATHSGKKGVEIDFSRDSGRGRIYRIVSNNEGQAKYSMPGSASVDDLVQMLGHANGWHRKTAQRLLIDRADRQTVSQLRHLAMAQASSLARLHALWTLEGMNILDGSLVRTALIDEDPRIREHGLRLAEGHMPELANAVMARLRETAPRVRLQLVLTLGKIEGNHRLLARLSSAYGVKDNWMRTALLVSSEPRSLQVLTRILARHRSFFDEPTPGKQEFVKKLAIHIGIERDVNDVTMLLITLDGSPVIGREPWLLSALDGLGKGLARPGKKRLHVPSAEHVLLTLLQHQNKAIRTKAAEVCQYLLFSEFTDMALVSAQDKSLPAEKRARAVRYLRGGNFARVAGVLRAILESSSPQTVKLAAVETVAKFDNPGTGKILISSWPGLTREARRQALQTLLNRSVWASSFLSAAEIGSVDFETIDEIGRTRLREYPDEVIQKRAKALFGASKYVVPKAETILVLEGRIGEGKALFRERCVSCHEAQDGCGPIGPNLTGISKKTREELLIDVVAPGDHIARAFTKYIVLGRDGSVYDGLLLRETATEVMLRNERGEVSIERNNIARIYPSNGSLMPSGSAFDFASQQLADVIDFLRVEF